MKQMLRITYSFLLLIGYQSVCGQQVYQSADFGTPGTIYLYNRLFGFNQDTAVTKSGADVTWDLSAATELNTHASEIVSPGQAFDFLTFVTICTFGDNSFIECSNIWANTQQAWLVQDTISLFQFVLADLQRFQRKTGNLLLENFIGFNADLGGLSSPAVIVYNNPDTILHFPVVYGDQYTSGTSWSIDLSATGQNIQYLSQQHRTTSIDSWGTLVTPYQTFENVVRMRSVIERQDSISTDSFQMPLSFTQIEYMWFDTAYKLPVMMGNGVIVDSLEILGTIEYLYDATCESPTWSVSTNSDEYVLDESGAITIEFTIHDGNADEYTWDWGNGEFEVTTGSVSHTFTEPGSYAVGVIGCMTNCLPLNSCIADVIDFEILVSIPSIPGEDVGIRLYPNPVQDELNMVLPESIGTAKYSIVDMNGKTWIQGNTLMGRNVIRSDGLPAGVYTIEITTVNQPGLGRYYSRFTIVK